MFPNFNPHRDNVGAGEAQPHVSFSTPIQNNQFGKSLPSSSVPVDESKKTATTTEAEETPGMVYVERKPWTAEEDDLLVQFKVHRDSSLDWDIIAARIGRSLASVKSRWQILQKFKS